MDHVRVPVLPPLAQPPNDDVVAVEAWVIGPLHDRAGGCGSEGRLAAGGDVEALVDTPAVARRPELPHRPAGAMWPAHREEVAVELDAAGLLLAAAGDSDDDAIGAVGDRPPGVIEPVPALDLIPAGCTPGSVDPPHLVARARDPDAHVRGRRAADPELDPHAADRSVKPRVRRRRVREGRRRQQRTSAARTASSMNGGRNTAAEPRPRAAAPHNRSGLRPSLSVRPGGR